MSSSKKVVSIRAIEVRQKGLSFMAVLRGWFHVTGGVVEEPLMYLMYHCSHMEGSTPIFNIAVTNYFIGSSEVLT